MDPRERQDEQDRFSRERFLELTKDALERFYDLSYLEKHPFARKVKQKDEGHDAARGQLLQKDLSRAISMLDSSEIRSLSSSPLRRHHVLRLRYVERLTIQSISYELDTSERQVYRDLRQGEEDVATILQSWYVEETAEPSTDDPDKRELVTLEIEQLKTEFQTIDIKSLVYSARASIEQLLSIRNVSVDIQAPPEPVLVSTDPVVAKHVLINLLSSAAQRSDANTLRLHLRSTDDRTSLSLQFTDETDGHDPLLNDITTEILYRLKWEILQNCVQNSTHILELSFGKNIPMVLVVDDFEGLSQLLKRYLAGYRCYVVAAADGASGLGMARELQPDAVILDVMMPDMDGWEVLQRLRNHPDTQHIAVIICSVFNDPGLAHALGASSFL
ncbi:MAG: response regulator, partial [Chloroflexi bacterium]|nr:response regulator [Chloroflexota bacterium]